MILLGFIVVFNYCIFLKTNVLLVKSDTKESNTFNSIFECIFEFARAQIRIRETVAKILIRLINSERKILNVIKDFFFLNSKLH